MANLGYFTSSGEKISKAESAKRFGTRASRSSKKSGRGDGSGGPSSPLTFENAPPGYVLNPDKTISPKSSTTSQSSSTIPVQNVSPNRTQPTATPTRTPLDTPTPQARTRFGRRVNAGEVQEMRQRLEQIEARKERFQQSKGIKRIRKTAEFLTPGIIFKGDNRKVATNVVEGFLGFPLQLGAVAGEAVEKGAILTQAFFKTGFDTKEGKKEAGRAAREVRDIYTDVNDEGKRRLSIEGKSAIVTAAIGAGISAGTPRSNVNTGKSLFKDVAGRKSPRARPSPRGRGGRPPIVILRNRQPRSPPKVTKLDVGPQSFKIEKGKQTEFITEVTQKNIPRKQSKPSRNQAPFRVVEQQKTTSIVSSPNGRQVTQSKARFGQQTSVKQVTTQLTIERTFKKRPLARKNTAKPFDSPKPFVDNTKPQAPFRRPTTKKGSSSGTITETISKDLTLQRESFTDKLIARAVEQSRKPSTQTQSKAQATTPKAPIERVVSREETIPRIGKNQFGDLSGKKKSDLKPPVFEAENIKPSIDITKDTTIRQNNIFVNKFDSVTASGQSQTGLNSLDLGRGFVPRQSQDLTTSPIITQLSDQAIDGIDNTISPSGGGGRRPRTPPSQPTTIPILPPLPITDITPGPRRPTPRIPPPPRVREPIKKTPLFAAPFLIPKSRSSNVFTTQVFSKGSFSSIGRRRSKEGAFSLGSRAVGGSALRTFRILRGGSPVSLSPTGKFRRSKSQPFAVVEKSQYAINTPGELFEIPGAKKRRKKKR